MIGDHASKKQHTPHATSGQNTSPQQLEHHITGQKHAVDALQESERCFSAVWEAASDAMALSLPDGIVIAANTAYYQLYGYTPEEVIGQNFAIIFPQEQRQWAREGYDDRFQSPIISLPVEASIMRADGTARIVEVSYNFITDNGKRTAMLSIIRDITERKKAEVDFQENAVKLHLNELKDHLLTHINHELRTPLTALYGYLELLKENHERLDTAIQVTFLDRAIENCNKLTLLLNTITEAMQLTREVKPAQYEELAVAGVVWELLDQLSLQIEPEHIVQLDIPEQLIVWADKQYFCQVLLNLLSNAFKYAPKQTPIVISAVPLESSTEQGPDAFPQVCISVKDAGPGIPADEMPLLFEKFIRLKRDVTGTVRGAGLGLYISKQLVEAMGGRIWVESSSVEGEGSCFCFTLPLAAHIFRHV